MEPVETFTQFCHKLCKQYEGRTPDYQHVGQQIEDAGESLSGHVHPMIIRICNNAFDLAYDLPTGSTEAELAWEDICETVQRYIDGQWEPTIWSLMATYSINRQQGLGVSVARQHGKVAIETTSPELRKMVTSLLKKIDNAQADEWYLRNLAHLLPQQAENLTKMTVEVQEYLSEIAQ